MVLLKKILLPLFLFTALAGYGQTTYYASPTGSDATGTGTEINPWASLYKATTTVTTSGDIIRLLEGTYTETSQSSLALGVSLYADDGTTITSTSALNPILTVNSSAGDAVNGNQTISGIDWDGDLTAYKAITINFRSNVTITNCTFIDFVYNGIWFDGTSSAYNVTPTNEIAENNAVSYCTFTNCTQYTSNSATGLIRMEGQADMVISNCTFDQTDRAAGDNADILCGYQNYGLQIIDCEFTKPDANGTAYNFFAEVHNTHGGFLVSGCTFNGAAAFDMSGVTIGDYAYGGRVEDCTFTTTSSPAMSEHDEPYLDLESFNYENDITVTRCRFNNSRTAIKINNIQTSAARIKINYNIFENVGNTTNAYSNAILIQSNWADTDPIPIREIDIQNNVMESNQSSYSGILVSCWGDIDVLNIKNNIIYGTFGRPIRITYNGGTPTVDSLSITSNNFYGNTSTAISYSGDVTYTNLTESDNITTDPLFTSSTDFNLQETSPCIDAGVDVDLTTDYDGETVPSGALPDIGAYEYQGTTPTPEATTTGFGKISSTKFGKSASGNFVKL